MRPRCIAGDDAGKYFATVDPLFEQRGQLIEQTKDTLQLIGNKVALTKLDVAACEKDQTVLDKLKADQALAIEILKVEATADLLRQWRNAQRRNVVRENRP